MEGSVKWFNVRKGFGFISGEDGQDYFVHFSALKKGTFIRENDRVSFEAVETDKGKQAKEVVLLQKGSEIAGGSDKKQSDEEEYSEDEVTEDEVSEDEETSEDEQEVEEEF
ncbi:cold shock domain-containing protein [Candidatus Woesearchaeota archaeon]|nr:cold shock domain-containing protein [Candidatus Woesearchaeota archaeon]